MCVYLYIYIYIHKMSHSHLSLSGQPGRALELGRLLDQRGQWTGSKRIEHTGHDVFFMSGLSSYVQCHRNNTCVYIDKINQNISKC